MHSGKLIPIREGMPRSVAAIQSSLDTWYAARDAIANGQAYSINGRTLTKASLEQVNKTIQQMERELSIAQSTAAGRPRIFTRGRTSGLGY